jgi:dsRNA-specific ribonuclease
LADHNPSKNQHKPPVKLEDVSLLSTLYFIGRIANVLSPHDDQILRNPIGALQEFCMSLHWPRPHYELAYEEGLPHKRVFTFACEVLNHRETG